MACVRVVAIDVSEFEIFHLRNRFIACGSKNLTDEFDINIDFYHAFIFPTRQFAV